MTIPGKCRWWICMIEGSSSIYAIGIFDRRMQTLNFRGKIARASGIIKRETVGFGSAYEHNIAIALLSEFERPRGYSQSIIEATSKAYTLFRAGIEGAAPIRRC